MYRLPKATIVGYGIGHIVAMYTGDECTDYLKATI